MVRAEDEAALRIEEKELEAKYKKDFDALWNKFTPHLRKLEIKKGWFLPELTNVPSPN